MFDLFQSTTIIILVDAQTVPSSANGEPFKFAFVALFFFLTRPQESLIDFFAF